MLKPKKLTKGDFVAIVSLSGGLAGEKNFIHKYKLGKKRLEEEFGLKTITMPNALKGCDFLYNHPDLRAKDFMDAIKDDKIKAIITNIGGEDTIRLLPFIDLEEIRKHPKILLGFSDTTSNHFMMYNAGVTSYYGPSLMCQFAENVKMHEYTKKYIKEVLFENKDNIIIKSSNVWTSEFLDWCNEFNNSVERKMLSEKKGFEIIQGSGVIEGELLGGCIDTFQMIFGTPIWPELDKWENKILFIETSESEMDPKTLKYCLRNIAAQGIFEKIKGIIVGKPKHEKYYEEYKDIYIKVVNIEEKKYDLPIIYNVNIGHTDPICIFPLGQHVKLDLENEQIIFTEKPMSE